MKDGAGAGEPADNSRGELYDAYVNFHRQLGTKVGPCRDTTLQEKATQYLLREPEPRGAFTVFPFYQAVCEGPDSLSRDCRKHLCAFIKATELLETLCVNLFLQPWKKEIKTLKTFTGPFVYCLLPVFSSSTIKSVLASIGYLPHTDTPSEFRLSEDANPDRAMEVGFEMVLARVECFHLLELLEKDQLGTQEWLEVLQRRAGHRKPEEPAGKKEEANRREVTTYLDTRLSEHPQPKPRSSNVMSVDQSIMEMQRTYPDLVFRGRPLVPDKPHQANSSKGVHTAVDDSKGAELAKRDSVTGTRAAALTVCSKADNMFGENSQICNDDFITTGSVIQGIAISSSTDGSGADELSGPQAISLHITLRTGSKAEKSPKPREPQPTAEPPGRRQQQTAADALNKSLAKAEPSSLSSVDEEQELRELAQRMGQLHVHEFKEEAKRKEEHKKGGENTNKERRLKWRKPRTEEDPEQQNFRKPVMETGGELSHDAGRHSRSSQSDHTVTEQNQPNMYHPSAVAVTTADCESCKGEGGTGQHEGEDPGRVDAGQRQDQLAHSFVIVEPHKK